MFKNLLNLFVIVLLLAGGIPALAQGNGDTVVVTLKINKLTANDLQEDGFIDNQDEILFEYAIQEVTAQGVRTENVAAELWGMTEMTLGQSATNFNSIGLEIRRDSRVRVEMRLVESEARAVELDTAMDAACALSFYGCIGALLVSSQDTEFEGPASAPTYSVAEMRSGVRSSIVFEWHGMINHARYTVDYSLSVSGGSSNPAPTQASQPASSSSSNTRNADVVTLPGSFGSELGCAPDSVALGGDWEPGCLYARMVDSDNDGTYTFTTTRIPAGTWEVKVTVGKSWEENYGINGVAGGDNITFTVPANNTSVTFEWNSRNKRLSIDTGSRGTSAAPAQDFSVLWRDDFNSPILDSDSWNVWLRNPMITGGALRMSGYEDWDYGLQTQESLRAGQGMVMAFQFEYGMMNIQLGHGDWFGQDLKRWELALRDSVWAVSQLSGPEGVNATVEDHTSLRPGTTYILMMHRTAGGTFEAALWEQSKPGQYVLHVSRNLGREWVGGDWFPVFQVYSGQLNVDWFQIVDLPAEYHLPTGAPPALE